MKKCIWIFILVAFSIQMANACDCVMKNLPELQKREIESSKCIFIGKITEVNEDLTYKITVVESLDGGDIQGNVYIGQNWKYCYPYVEEDGTWLVYARMENGFLKMNACGLSRSFDNPFSPMSDSKEIDEYAAKMKLKKMSDEEILSGMLKIELANEINALRRRRELTRKVRN